MPTVQEALQLGLTHQRSGDLAAAEQVYRKILSVAPGHPDVLHLLGLIASQQGRVEEAIARIGAAIAEDGSAALYHHNLANVYLAQQHVREAEASYRRALAVQPDYLMSQRQLAGLLYASGRAEESATWWRQRAPALPRRCRRPEQPGRNPGRRRRAGSGQGILPGRLAQPAQFRVGA